MLIEKYINKTKMTLNIKSETDLYKQFNQTNIVRILRLVTRYMNNEISQRLTRKGHGGLSVRHLSVFENLDFEGTNIVSLAGRAGMTKQAMSKLVKETTHLGYVSVKTDPKDSRVVTVVFTDKGIDFLRDLREEIAMTRDEILNMGIISGKEATEMTTSLIKLLNYFKTTFN